MDFLNWYDWITATNPYASIFFGIIFAIVSALAVWLDTKKIRTTIVTVATGLGVTFIGVLLLNAIGYYS